MPTNELIDSTLFVTMHSVFHRCQARPALAQRALQTSLSSSYFLAEVPVMHLVVSHA